jgi:hypothetical protein
MIMMDDAVKGKNLDERVKVRDLVELVSESLQAKARDEGRGTGRG